MIRARFLGPVVAIAVFLAGCSVAGPLASDDPVPSSAIAEPTPSPAPASPDPCPGPESTPIPEASLPASLDDETREAVRLRTEYGLRHDLAWVREVAADPTAVMDFGVPMLPVETASLFARNELADPVRRVLDGYGHTDEFGGLYIDNAQGGVIVVLWTTDPAVHDAAIRPQLPPCHPLESRQFAGRRASFGPGRTGSAPTWTG